MPNHLHPHGTAIVNTLQQVSVAIGTALYISIMSSGQKQYLRGAGDPHAPAEIAVGPTAVIIALVALVLGLFIRKGKSPEQEPVAEEQEARSISRFV